MRVLVLNAGSSSLKASVVDEGRAIARATIEWGSDATRRPDREAGLRSALEELFLAGSPLGSIEAVGHRVVHGGARFAEPARLDAGIVAQLEKLVPMAPLHQPYDLAAIRTLMKLRPELPQVACFDTAFHRAVPALAQTFALPREITAAGVRRYGFHGLSYEYIAAVLPEHLGARAEGRVVVAHLGNGASMCAMRARRSIATTMGFTALEGLMMGTRSGSIDPGVVFYLMRERSMSADEVEHLLYYQSGLLGVSGVSSDMRELLASKDPRAREAVELFAYRAARELGSLAAALGGLDALVFTAGIGERAAPVRAMICEQARWLGVELDAIANESHRAVISSAGSRVTVCVVPTDEEIVIARHSCRLLGIGRLAACRT